MIRMSTVDEIISKVRSLPLEDQNRIVSELSQDLLIHKLRAIETNPVDPPPVSDDELDRLVHEARGEVQRARHS